MIIQSESKESKFDASISHWTLSFHDPAYEAAFAQKYTRNFHLPLAGMFVIYIVIVYILVYRFYAIYVLVNHVTGYRCGTLAEELSVLFMIVGAMLIEGILKLTHCLVHLQGLLLYINFAICYVLIAFYTHDSPAFSIS